MREILAAVWVASLAGCGEHVESAVDAHPGAPDARPMDVADARPGPVDGEYRIAWSHVTFGAESPIESAERLTIASGAALFADVDGACPSCGATLTVEASSASCVEVAPATIGSKAVESGALCASEAGIDGMLVMSGYPGPPQAVTWRITGDRL